MTQIGLQTSVLKNPLCNPL